MAVDDIDDSVRELLPALALVRTGCMSAHGQASVEHQHATLGPRGEVPADDSIRTCAIRAVGKKKRINGKGREERRGIGGWGVREITHPCFGGTKP